tara:strand:+ start:3911 stop:4117 length:207 start_codon:yes stop_codon:yes gene_type:complete
MSKSKDDQRDQLKKHMEMFLNDGGKIKIIPQGVSKEMIRLKKSVTHPGRVTYEEENKFNYDSAYHATK